MGKNGISIDNLSYELEDVKIFDRLTLEVPRGIRFGLLGPKNSGKTNLIRLLTGSLKPASGTMDVFGFDPQTQAMEIRHRMGIMLNPPELYDSLSIMDNMEFYAWARELSSDERQERIFELLNHFGLWEKRHHMVESLSVEQKLRLGMATLFLHRPPLIFLDDPTAGLEPMAAARLREELGLLIDNRPLLTVFLTTDNQADASRFCEQVAIFHEGKVIREGTPAELGLSGALPKLKLAGEGFNPIILQLLIAEPEVDQAEIRDGNLYISLKAGMDMDYLTSLIEEAGGKIHGTLWEDNMGDILTGLIESENEKKIKLAEKEVKPKNEEK
jgi:ABC-2 type transport system ATP-binding protein